MFAPWLDYEADAELLSDRRSPFLCSFVSSTSIFRRGDVNALMIGLQLKCCQGEPALLVKKERKKERTKESCLLVFFSIVLLDCCMLLSPFFPFLYSTTAA